MYAFAVIVWEVLTGERPWKADSKGRPYNDAAIVMAVISGERPPFPARLPLSPRLKREGDDAHKVLRRVVKESWAHEPSARPEFAALQLELRDELRRELERRDGSHEALHALNKVVEEADGGDSSGESVTL